MLLNHVCTCVVLLVVQIAGGANVESIRPLPGQELALYVSRAGFSDEQRIATGSLFGQYNALAEEAVAQARLRRPPAPEDGADLLEVVHLHMVRIKDDSRLLTQLLGYEESLWTELSRIATEEQQVWIDLAKSASRNTMPRSASLFDSTGLGHFNLEGALFRIDGSTDVLETIAAATAPSRDTRCRLARRLDEELLLSDREALVGALGSDPSLEGPALSEEMMRRLVASFQEILRDAARLDRLTISAIAAAESVAGRSPEYWDLWTLSLQARCRHGLPRSIPRVVAALTHVIGEDSLPPESIEQLVAARERIHRSAQLLIKGYLLEGRRWSSMHVSSELTTHNKRLQEAVEAAQAALTELTSGRDWWTAGRYLTDPEWVPAHTGVDLRSSSVAFAPRHLAEALADACNESEQAADAIVKAIVGLAGDLTVESEELEVSSSVERVHEEGQRLISELEQLDCLSDGRVTTLADLLVVVAESQVIAAAMPLSDYARLSLTGLLLGMKRLTIDELEQLLAHERVVLQSLRAASREVDQSDGVNRTICGHHDAFVRDGSEDFGFGEGLLFDRIDQLVIPGRLARFQGLMDQLDDAVAVAAEDKSLALEQLIDAREAAAASIQVLRTIERTSRAWVMPNAHDLEPFVGRDRERLAVWRGAHRRLDEAIASAGLIESIR